MGLISGDVFDNSILVAVKQALLQQYYNLGYYNARIETKITPTSENRVKIDLLVKEGVIAKIKDINIIGNRDYSEQQLLDALPLSRSTIFTFITDKDVYSKAKLAKCLDALRSFYLDRGYLSFKIDSTKVSMTPNKRYVYIAIHITEGDIYKIAGIQLTGNLLGKKQELLNVIKLKKGDIFSRENVVASINNIQKFLGDYGYASVTVKPSIKISDNDKRLVFVNFVVSPGNRFYVRRIFFLGNSETADRVLRREMRQMEGAMFSSSNIEQSTQQLYSLGFVGNIKPEIQPVEGSPHEVDLQYSLKESSAVTASVQAGYSDASHFVGGGSISDANFLGTGKTIGLNANYSAYLQVYSLNYYNPYFTTNNIGLDVNAFVQDVKSGQEWNMSAYSEGNSGISTTFYVPISQHNRFNMGLGFEHPHITLYELSPESYTNFIQKYGSTFNFIELKAGWSYSNLDRYLYPRKGLSQSLNAQISLPVFGDSLNFYKVNYDLNYYHPLNKYFVFHAHAFLGYGNGYGKKDGDKMHLPFFENYYAGGLGSVRGYESSSLGPKDRYGNALGGNVSVNASVGIVFPNPFGSSVRTTLFLDSGNIYSTTRFRGINLNLLRYSVGVQLEWRTPFAPLVFSLAEPINMHSGDEKSPFQFQIGASF